jgi:uncharacterized protein DUF4439
VLIRSGLSEYSLPGRPPFVRPLSRRQLLGLAAVGLTAGLTGCSPTPPAAPPPPLEPDELSVNRAVDAARTLRTDTLALAAARPELATLLGRMVSVHEQHLVALGSPIGSAGASASGSASASAGPSATAGPAPTAPQLIKAEIAAARMALRDGEAAAPAFAVLLCRIAAARIVNADLLGVAVGRKPSGVLKPERPAPAASPPAPSPGSSPGSSTPSASGTGASAPASTTGAPTSTDPVETGPADPADLKDPDTPALIALDRLLAGEHAAVFAYPLVIARTTGSRRTLAAALWQAHRTERDELATRLLNAGARPAVAEPAYDVGTLPSSSARAAALAARVESGLAALAADLVATGEAGDGDRVLGADQLVLAARQTAGWTGRPAAFPGLTVPRSTTATPTAWASGTTSPPGTTSPFDTTPPFGTIPPSETTQPAR